MIVELGHFATIVALVMAAALAGAGYRSAVDSAWRRLVETLAVAQFATVGLGFAALVYAFVTSDFSVQYVAENSNMRCPGTTGSARPGVATKVRSCSGRW